MTGVDDLNVANHASKSTVRMDKPLASIWTWIVNDLEGRLQFHDFQRLSHDYWSDSELAVAWAHQELAEHVSGSFKS